MLCLLWFMGCIYIDPTHVPCMELSNFLLGRNFLFGGFSFQSFVFFSLLKKNICIFFHVSSVTIVSGKQFSVLVVTGSQSVRVAGRGGAYPKKIVLGHLH